MQRFLGRIEGGRVAWLLVHPHRQCSTPHTHMYMHRRQAVNNPIDRSIPYAVPMHIDFPLEMLICPFGCSFRLNGAKPWVAYHMDKTTNWQHLLNYRWFWHLDDSPMLAIALTSKQPARWNDGIEWWALHGKATAGALQLQGDCQIWLSIKQGWRPTQTWHGAIRSDILLGPMRWAISLFLISLEKYQLAQMCFAGWGSIWGNVARAGNH